MSDKSPKDEAIETNSININELRFAANHHFSKQEYDTALPFYEIAASTAKKEKSPDVVLHLNNLSACLYKMDKIDEALDAAAEAVSLSEGKNAKAYFRLARCQISLGQCKTA